MPELEEQAHLVGLPVGVSWTPEDGLVLTVYTEDLGVALKEEGAPEWLLDLANSARRFAAKAVVG